MFFKDYPLKFFKLQCGLNMAYQTFGNKNNTPIILLEGMGSDMYAYNDTFCIAPLVNLGYYVIRIEHRDNGQSDFMTSYGNNKIKRCLPNVLNKYSKGAFPLCTRKIPYSLYDIVDDIRQLLDYLSIEKLYLAGHSMGGMIAQIFSILYRNRTLGLLLCSTSSEQIASNLPGVGLVKDVYKMFLPRPKNTTVKEFRRLHYKYFKKMCGDLTEPDYLRIYANKKYDTMGVHPLEYKNGGDRQLISIVSCPSRTFALNLFQLLSITRIPIYIIHGTKDTVLPVENAFFMLKNIRHSKCHIVHGAGHCMGKPFFKEIISIMKELKK
tara:strand:+ start:157 stop:1125 length:969 start_codon:yes stop_codon:yes gene_type:complete